MVSALCIGFLQSIHAKSQQKHKGIGGISGLRISHVPAFKARIGCHAWATLYSAAMPGLGTGEANLSKRRPETYFEGARFNKRQDVNMKAITLTILLGATAAAMAQSNFIANLTSSESPSITGAAAFTLNGTAVNFTLSLTQEDVVPESAQLVGPQSTFEFDLGEPFITIHSPGPWPNGYDGSTAFFGSFTLPDELEDDFVAGRTTLELLGSRMGDFRGPVLPAQTPQIAAFTRNGSMVQLSFTAEPPYQYTIEYSASLGNSNRLSFTNVSALSQTFETVISDPITNSARFYRVRRDLCCQ